MTGFGYPENKYLHHSDLANMENSIIAILNDRQTRFLKCTPFKTQAAMPTTIGLTFPGCIRQKKYLRLSGDMTTI